MPGLKSLGNLVMFLVSGLDGCSAVINKEFLVDVSHELTSITSLPFVHTARRSYRLNVPVNASEVWSASFTIGSYAKDV
jgi:hypothetical protein